MLSYLVLHYIGGIFSAALSLGLPQLVVNQSFVSVELGLSSVLSQAQQLPNYLATVILS